MSLKRALLLLPHLCFLALFVAITPTLLAQTDCPALVSRALDAIGDNCGGLARNTACYGYNLVNASFVTEVEDDFFTTPADQAGVDQIETLTTTPLSVEDDRWGVAVMSLQANIPNTLPGQAVTFILLGDVEIENAVDPGAAFAPADGVSVTATRVVNIRSAGALTANVIGAIDTDEPLLADGLSADGQWLRVAYRDLIGWVFRDLVASEADLDALPVISEAARTPMQAFYLRTGIGQVACEDAPADSLVIQGPQRLTVNFTVNGADVALGSTAAFRILPPGDLMEVSVLDGKATIAGVEVRQGFRTTLCLSEPEDRGLDGDPNDREVSCPPSAPERIDAAAQESWCALGEVAPNPLNYPIPIRCGEGIVFPTPVPAPDGTGTITVPGPRGSCAALRPTSPLSDAPSSPTTFYWDGIAAATRYEVVLLDAAWNETRRVGSNGAATSTGVSGLIEETQFSWYVIAYDGDTALCRSGIVGPIPVVGPQINAEPPPPASFGVFVSGCFYDDGEITIVLGFTGDLAPNGEPMRIFYANNFEETTDMTFTAFPQPNFVTLVLFGRPTGQVTFTRLATNETVTIPRPSCPVG